MVFGITTQCLALRYVASSYIATTDAKAMCD
ncbi:hypothetical protein PALA111701_25955 [Paenibacillus lactis]